jgi:hypothetical protein
MPQRADLRRATSSSGPRRNRIATPTWADEIFGKHKVSARMYLRCTCGVGCRRQPWKRTSTFSACVRTTIETGRGPTRNRHSSRTGRAESVLIPRGPQAAELRKLPVPPGSSRSSREPAQSCAGRPWAKPPPARNPVCRRTVRPGFLRPSRPDRAVSHWTPARPRTGWPGRKCTPRVPHDGPRAGGAADRPGQECPLTWIRPARRLATRKHRRFRRSGCASAGRARFHGHQERGPRREPGRETPPAVIALRNGTRRNSDWLV